MDWHSHGYKIDAQGETLTRDSILLCDLLQTRPQSGCTWDSVTGAVSWLSDQMWPEGPVKDRPLARLLNADQHPPAEELLERKLSFAREQLSRQQDVVWGEWLRGGRYVQCMLICCPNRVGNHTCPTRG